MNSGSRLRLITFQSTEKIADVSYLCKSTENRRRARKLEKEKCFDFQKGGKDELHNLQMRKLYNENRCNKFIINQAFVITLERIPLSLGVYLISVKLYVCNS